MVSLASRQPDPYPRVMRPAWLITGHLLVNQGIRCGRVNRKKTYAMVPPISRHKPMLNKSLYGSGVPDEAAPDSDRLTPLWPRGPMRVRFEPSGGTKGDHCHPRPWVDVVNDDDDDDEEEEEERSSRSRRKKKKKTKKR
jgi:hypothetical protein